MSKRVVITGTGWVTPLGTDVTSVWTKLLAGESALGPVTRFPASTFATSFAGEVKHFDLAHHLADTTPHAGAHINSRFALAAAAHAWHQAGLGNVGKSGQSHAGFTDFNPDRTGIYLGAGEGVLNFEGFANAALAGANADARAFDHAAFAERAYSAYNPEDELEQEPNLAVSHLSDAFNARGPAFNCMTACAASTQAIGEATEILRRGDADIMIAGGAHSMIHPLGMTGFIRLTAMSTKNDDPQGASRPFDRDRDGFVMGEGAGIVILESEEHARARGATPLCEVAGYGSSADAYRITDIEPNGLGAVAAMTQALEQAGVDPEATDDTGRPHVHYISAHGTGTKENDSIETKAVKNVFKQNASKVPFSSVKSMFGHLIQAAGAVELITCVEAIRSGFIPPTRNLTNPDANLDLDYVPNKSRDLREQGGVRVAMSNGFGFGGQNNTVLVRAIESE